MFPVIIVSGATATGKTKTSIEIALHLKENNILCEIINYDSLLFYKKLNIGTAKPSDSEKNGIRHHLIDIKDPNQPLNAADFMELANHLINDFQKKHIVPIFVGGSPFYIRAFVKGMADQEEISPEIVQKVEAIFQTSGIEKIRELLKEHDPKSFSLLHENDHYRNIRALEYYFATGTPFSLKKDHLEKNLPFDFSNPINKNLVFHHIYLNVPKDEHWKIIEDRVKSMLNTGLIDEIKDLICSGYQDEKPMQSIGYKEVQSFLSGEIKSKDELIEKIFIATRKLAKSQKTFYNKIVPKVSYNPLSDLESIKKDVTAFLEKYVDETES